MPLPPPDPHGIARTWLARHQVVCPFSWTTRGGRTAVAIAAKEGNLWMLRWLINTGSNAHIVSHVLPDDHTGPLRCAIRGGHLDVCRFLVSWGAGETIKRHDAADVETHLALVLDELLVLFFKGLRFGQEAATLLSSINRSKKLRTRKTHLFQQISQLLAIFLLEILIVGARLRAPVVNNLSYVISLDGNRGQTVK